MKKITRSPYLFLLFLVFACVPQTPIPVYITPTSQESSPVPSTTPNVGALPVATDTETVIAPPTGEGSPQNVGPSATFVGAIVGPEYTLQPTETPRPTETQTPTEGPSVTPTYTPSPTFTPGPTATPVPKLDRSRMGIQVDPNLDVDGWNAAMHHAEIIGVSWIKVQANWSFLQPNSPQDFDQSFALFQLHVQNAKQRGFKVLVSVVKAPKWARPSNQNDDGPPDDPQLLGNFITFLLGKIGNVTDAIEVWNEPNLVREWTGVLPFNGAGYMQLFGPAYGAIRGYSSAMSVITAGLAPTGDSPYSVDDRIYLQQMFDAGLRNFTDVVVGMHPYSWGNPPDARCCNAVDGQNWDDDPHFFFANNIEDYRNILTQNGFSGVQLWATEYGWATWDWLAGTYPDGDDWMTYNDVWKQANYTIRALEIGQSLDYMGPMILWNLNFASTQTVAERREVAAYSLLVPDAVPQERPLYWLLHDATAP